MPYNSGSASASGAWASGNTSFIRADNPFTWPLLFVMLLFERKSYNEICSRSVSITETSI